MKRKRYYAYEVGIFEARSLVTINSECIQIAGGCDLQLNVSLLEHNVFQSYIFFSSHCLSSRDCCTHAYMNQSASVFWKKIKYIPDFCFPPLQCICLLM